LDIDSRNIFFRNLPAGFKQPSDDAGQTLLREYGAVFIARGGAVPPKTVFFKDETDVSEFQSGVEISSVNIGGFEMELQAAAKERLEKAIEEAGEIGLAITPRSGDSARRSYGDTVGLWASRVDPALAHWVGKGRLDQTEADRIGGLSPFEQVPEIFALEAKGMYCAKDLSKSIIYSVAPPGASQHLSMLAFDVSEFDNPVVREILAGHFWYQTVVSDLPHFTFLGVRENELADLGLKKIVGGERVFWVPDF
jgi:hypothetical protein